MNFGQNRKIFYLDILNNNSKIIFGSQIDEFSSLS